MIGFEQIKKVQDAESLRTFLLEALQLTELNDEQLIWVNALYEASVYSEFKTKDIASILLEGLKPINSLDDVTNTLNQMKEDGEYEYIYGLCYYLMYVVGDCFGHHDIAEQIRGVQEWYENNAVGE